MATRIGLELRTARLIAGRSQQDIAAAARISQATVSRMERGMPGVADLESVGIVAALVGLDLSVNLYAGPRVLRDGPSVALLERPRVSLGPDWRWRFEVLVAAGDARAWDAVIRHARTGLAVAIDAETRILDIQALLRRVNRKRAASTIPRVMLLVAGTRRNREAIAAARHELAAEFPVSQRRAFRALRAGIDPGGDILAVLGPAVRSTHP